MSAELSFVDTNVLVYALYEEVEHHVAARHLVDRAKQSDAALCTAPQVLAEFYAVVTDPRRVSVALEPRAAIEEIQKLRERPGFAVLEVPNDIVDRWIDLALRYSVTKQDVFDLQLVAVMLAHGVKKIDTWNTSDFRRFVEVEALAPPAP